MSARLMQAGLSQRRCWGGRACSALALLCAVSALVAGFPVAFCRHCGHSMHGFRRPLRHPHNQRLGRLALAAKGPGISRSTHNSYQQELYDREALELSAEEAVDESMVPSLKRVADVMQLGTKCSVLDVGCGSGLMLRFYEEAGVALPKVTGLDLSEGMLTHAKRRHPSASFAHGDICSYEDPDFRLYDRVVFNGCFQNLHDREHALRHVTEELIAGGGLIVISEPKGRAFSREMKETMPRAYLHSLPTKRQFQDILSGLGSSGTSSVITYSSPLLSLESIHDHDDFYCAVLRRSCADF